MIKVIERQEYLKEKSKIKILIKELFNNDNDKIANLEETIKHLNFIFNQDTNKAFLLLNIVDNKLISMANFLEYNNIKKDWCAFSIFTLKSERKKGYAKELLEIAINLIKEKGGNKLIAGIEYNNMNSIKLHESLGFLYEGYDWNQIDESFPKRHKCYSYNLKGENMNQIAIIKDEAFGLKSKEFNNPRIRYGARGIVINDNLIAVFNKSNKNEYKLPGGGIDDGENKEEAFKREVKEETGCEVEIIAYLGTIEEHKTLDNFKQISYVFVSKVINNTKELALTDKEKDEGAKLLWLDEKEALNKITNCLNELKESNYENLYHSKFIVTRDRLILEYYLNNKSND